MMLNHVPRKSYLEFGFTKFSGKHCTKVQNALSISVSECSKSTERTAVHSLRLNNVQQFQVSKELTLFGM